MPSFRHRHGLCTILWQGQVKRRRSVDFSDKKKNRQKILCNAAHRRFFQWADFQILLFARFDRLTRRSSVFIHCTRERPRSEPRHGVSQLPRRSSAISPVPRTDHTTHGAGRVKCASQRRRSSHLAGGRTAARRHSQRRAPDGGPRQPPGSAAGRSGRPGLAARADGQVGDGRHPRSGSAVVSCRPRCSNGSREDDFEEQKPCRKRWKPAGW